MPPTHRRYELRRVLASVKPRALTITEIRQFAIYDGASPAVALGDLLLLLARRKLRIVPCSSPARWEVA
jgi:hypothetical protein